MGLGTLEKSKDLEKQKLEISDEYDMFFDGPLTEEEQELVNQLKLRQKVDGQFENLGHQQLEFDQILKGDPDEADNSDDEFSSLPASVEHIEHEQLSKQEDKDNYPDKQQQSEGRNLAEDNSTGIEYQRDLELKRSFDDFFTREEPLEHFGEDLESASEGSEDDQQQYLMHQKQKVVEKPDPVRKVSKIKHKGWQETVTSEKSNQAQLMELDFDPIQQEPGAQDFIQSNFDFDFDDSERDFL